MAPKQITTQALVDGIVIYNETLPGKAHARSRILHAMELIDANGKPGHIRQQTVGAKSWGVYSYIPGSNAANQIIGFEWKVSE